MEHNSDPIASISESQASGRTQEIFAQIRSSIGIGQVNLIWRAIAVDEQALEWTWSRLHPLYESGHVWGAAQTLRETLASLPGSTGGQFAMGNDEREAINSLLDIYLRANSTNYLSLLALCRTQTVAEAMTFDPVPAPSPIDYSPPGLLSVEAMPEALQECVLACNRLGTDERQPMMGSAWRQLAHWPQFLDYYLEQMQSRHEDRSLFSEIANVDTLGRKLAAGLRNLFPEPSQAPARVVELADYFTARALPRMLVLLSMAQSLVSERNS